MKLKCWFAGDRNPYEHQFVDVVFARSHKDAKRIVWGHGDMIGDECDGDYLRLRLTRKPEFDELADFNLTPYGELGYVPRDHAILRKMRFCMDGDNTCSSCGLAEFDGRWPVCPECHQCPDCGHDDDCPERVTDSNQEAA